jgi:hypothetical protein
LVVKLICLFCIGVSIVWIVLLALNYYYIL